MILKTALINGNGSASHYIGSTEGFAHFYCYCGKSFKLRETNFFGGWDSIECSDCKRIGRLSPNIGERYVFKRVKWDAKKAGRSFNLSFEWFVKAVHEPCHYCNRRDINKVSVASKIPGEFLLVDFRYNGLDRVDNSIGYEESNCVPCCVVCNRAKNSMPYDEFMEYIRTLVNYQSSVGDSNVNDHHAAYATSLPYWGRHRKAGNDDYLEELPTAEVPVYFDGYYNGTDVPSRSEWTRGISGGPYRTIERTV